MTATLILFALIGLGAGAYGFLRPAGVLRAAAIALGVAIALPFAVGYLAAPFLGEGAGMGAAFILVALSAFIALCALCAALGAGARHGWRAMGPER